MMVMMVMMIVAPIEVVVMMVMIEAPIEVVVMVVMMMILRELHVRALTGRFARWCRACRSVGCPQHCERVGDGIEQFGIGPSGLEPCRALGCLCRLRTIECSQAGDRADNTNDFPFHPAFSSVGVTFICG